MLTELDEFSNIKENVSSEGTIDRGEQLWYRGDLEGYYDEITEVEEPKKVISEGDTLPYGIRMYHGYNETFRLKDIGVKNRILIVGVIGSFTPLCWNYHLLDVLTKFKYFEERGISYICCISTNDSFTQGAWGTFLGCYDCVIMVGDPSKNFTKALGMDIVVPWLDKNIRSKRYVIYAEDMVVTKMLVAPADEVPPNWNCEHEVALSGSSETAESDSDNSVNSW